MPIEQKQRVEPDFLAERRAGPMMGQVGFFAFYAPEKVPLAIGRWMDDLAARPGVQRGMAITPPAKASLTMKSDQEVNA